MNLGTKTRRLRDEASTEAPVSLACRWCGVDVQQPDPARTEVLHVYGPRYQSDVARGLPAAPAEIAVTRCDACTDRRARAEALLAACPRVERAHGDVALDRLDAAYAAFDIAGMLKRSRMLANLTDTDERVMELIDSMAPLGAAGSWGRLGGTAPASKRWSHIKEELADEIHRTVARLMRRSVEFPFPFAPPRGALPGCLLCGVGTLLVKESDAVEAWGPEHSARPETLGGPPQPEPIRGHMCPACTNSVEAVGAIGMPAAERALLNFLGYGAVIGNRLEFTDRFRAWVALPAGTETNATPWAHLRLDRMRANLEKLERQNRAYRTVAS